MASLSDTNIIKRDEIDNMLPMELDDDGIENDSKQEGFLDEHEIDDENRKMFLHRSFSKSNRTTIRRFDEVFRKSHILLMTIGIAMMFSALALWGRLRTPVLRFRVDAPSSYYSHDHQSAAAFNQTFKIMQITDIHLGEAEYTDWGPEQDAKTFRLLEKIFEYEPDCDLIVLGGDQLTANNCLGNCTKYYGILGRFLSKNGVPWATIMGNHDDMAFEVEDGTGATVPHSYTRRDLLRVDQRFALSLSQSSPSDAMTGVTNYVVDVLDPVGTGIALQIFFLDSGGGSLKEAINDDQIQWFRKQAGLNTVPAVIFQHIPTQEYEYNDGICVGYQGEGVAEVEYDAGIVNAIVQSKRFKFLAVGHNHGNDYCCRYDNGNDNNNDQYSTTNDLFLCYGRHSGYGGYGKWDRGVRMYELLLTSDDGSDESVSTEDAAVGKEFKWRTWVSIN